MARYEEEKAAMGDDFYADLGTAAILPGRLKDSEEAKSRLVASVNAQIEKVCISIAPLIFVSRFNN